MTKQLEIERETQRAVDGLQSCGIVVQKIARFLERFIPHPSVVRSEFDPVSTLGPAADFLDAALARLRTCLTPAELAEAEAQAAAAQAENGVAAEPTADEPLGLSLEDEGDMAAPEPGTNGTTVHGENGEAEPAAPQCVLRGVTPGMPIPTVMEFLAANTKTGVLRVNTDHEMFIVEVANGNVVHAVSDSNAPDERLGSILLMQGVIGAETLQELLAEQRDDETLGEQLAREELATREQLQDALEQQVCLLFRRLFVTKAATFSFYEGETTSPDVHIIMNVTQLLLESARTTDEVANTPQLAWDEWLK
ncbi:MAG: DUF4388 domain-containing protein [Planctomycetota bacterium]